MEWRDWRWRELLQVEGSDIRWRGTRIWREAIGGGGEKSEVERSDCRCREAISSGGQLSLVEGAMEGRWERSQMEGSDLA